MSATGEADGPLLQPTIAMLERLAPEGPAVPGQIFGSPGRRKYYCQRPSRTDVTLQHASSWHEVLCSVSSNFSSSDSVSVVLQRTASLVNSDPARARAGVTASVIGSEQGGPGEDSLPQPLRLVLNTTGRTAFQLVPAVTGSIHAELGLESVGVPHRVLVGILSSKLIFSRSRAA